MEDIGQKLKAKREELGLSIEDIEAKTKIQKRYLEAIEENDFDRLPGDFYVRAFIKQYAGIVGLDGNELLNDFHQDVPQTKSEEYVENSVDNKSQKVKETINNRQGIWKNYLPYIFSAVGVIAVIGIIYFVYINVFANPNQSAPKTDDVVVTSKVDKESSSSSASTKSSSASSKKDEDKTSSAKELKITSTADYTYTVSGYTTMPKVTLSTTSSQVWLSVNEDNASVYQGMLTVGTNQEITPKDTTKVMTINLGNLMSPVIKINDQVVELPAATTKSNPQTVTLNFAK